MLGYTYCVAYKHKYYYDVEWCVGVGVGSAWGGVWRVGCGGGRGWSRLWIWYNDNYNINVRYVIERYIVMLGSVWLCVGYRPCAVDYTKLYLLAYPLRSTVIAAKAAQIRLDNRRYFQTCLLSRTSALDMHQAVIGHGRKHVALERISTQSTISQNLNERNGEGPLNRQPGRQK